MEPFAHDALNRAARLSELERAAALLPEVPARRWDLHALLAAALALLLTLYPGMSAAAVMMTNL
ncbi:MAG: hypothetical protein J1E43_07940 [Christensenellaceae bacterium]|nr:hypothetical protein [Christensenellaceae bacterium]